MDVPMLCDEPKAVHASNLARFVRDDGASWYPKDRLGYFSLPWLHHTLPFLII